VCGRRAAAVGRVLYQCRRGASIAPTAIHTSPTHKRERSAALVGQLILAAPTLTRRAGRERPHSSYVILARRCAMVAAKAARRRCGRRGESSSPHLRSSMRIASFAAVLAFSLAALAAQPSPVSPDFNTPRPIDAVDTVFIEDMTWMEVRDA